ncbi:MAG: glucose-6-phosphate dehydrogenase assembly protein OpcA [Actinomycetota bacterium]|nr:glucose-6-phosphate dehydrogenase assembly protein OpcA [Actinomycetota bacterium]
MADRSTRVTTLGTWESERVTVGQVEAALNGLRRHESRAAVRTSVLTLVAVVDEQEGADTVLGTVTELGARHPSRTVVLVVGEAEAESGLDACASVHLAERAGTTVCFEDVVLNVRGRARFHLDSIVEPFTLPDLPVVVWLPARLPSLGDPLLEAADRIVIDSRAVPERPDLLDVIARLARRLPLTDLSWIRLTPWRNHLAGLFEGGFYRPFLDQVERVEVSGNYGPRHLVGGWLLTRLQLSPEQITLAPADHVSIRIHAVSDGRTGHFTVARTGADRVIESSVDIDDGPSVTQTLYIHRQWPAQSLGQALTRMGYDETYREAVTGAQELRRKVKGE